MVMFLLGKTICQNVIYIAYGTNSLLIGHQIQVNHNYVEKHLKKENNTKAVGSGSEVLRRRPDHDRWCAF